MTTQSEFDRQLTAWLVDAAPQREPDGLLPRTMVHVRRSRRDPAWLVSLRGNAMGRRAKPASLVVALALLALLALAVLGGAVIGSVGRLPIDPPPPPPSATWGASLPQVFGLPGRFAFSSDRDGDLDVYTMNPDRTDLVQLTNRSRRRRRAAVVPGRAGGSPSPPTRNGDADIYVMNADGTGPAAADPGCGRRTPRRLVAGRYADRLRDRTWASGSRPLTVRATDWWFRPPSCRSTTTSTDGCPAAMRS